MPEILGFTSKKMIFEIENWYFCVVFSTNRTNLLNWLIKSANRKVISFIEKYSYDALNASTQASIYCVVRM